MDKFSQVVCGVAVVVAANVSLVVAETRAPEARPITVAVAADISVLHDVVIGKGGGRDLHAEIAYPSAAVSPLPAVVYVHGGAWSGGSHKRPAVLLQLAQAGYFAASIEYRLSGEAKWPAQIQDCRLAIRWLRANAAKYHVNPERIGVWGDSAGGHLAACLGTMAEVKEYEGDGGFPRVSSAVQAVIDFYGPTSLVATATDASGGYPPNHMKPIEALFGVPYAENPELWKSGSPLRYVKAGNPPMLLVHGDSDRTVHLAQSTMFAAALAKAGVPHQFLVVKNAGHGFPPLPHPVRVEIDRTVYDFLAKYLKKS